jgi:hypothetical protein
MPVLRPVAGSHVLPLLNASTYVDLFSIMAAGPGACPESGDYILQISKGMRYFLIRLYIGPGIAYKKPNARGGKFEKEEKPWHRKRKRSGSSGRPRNYSRRRPSTFQQEPDKSLSGCAAAALYFHEGLAAVLPRLDLAI